jgi:hypothetical protein
LDSRVVESPLGYNPTFVIFSSLKALFFNSLESKPPFSADSYPQSYESIDDEVKGPKLLRRRASVWYV